MGMGLQMGLGIAMMGAAEELPFLEAASFKAGGVDFSGLKVRGRNWWRCFRRTRG